MLEPKREIWRYLFFKPVEIWELENPNFFLKTLFLAILEKLLIQLAKFSQKKTSSSFFPVFSGHAGTAGRQSVPSD
jgi:hypothetical protein